MGRPRNPPGGSKIILAPPSITVSFSRQPPGSTSDRNNIYSNHRTPIYSLSTRRLVKLHLSLLPALSLDSSASARSPAYTFLRSFPRSSLATPPPWPTCELPRHLSCPRSTANVGGRKKKTHQVLPMAFADRVPLFRNVDVLVIGMGPTGLGAAKRLNHIVGAHRQLPTAVRTRLTTSPGRSFLAHCRLL